MLSRLAKEHYVCPYAGELHVLAHAWSTALYKRLIDYFSLFKCMLYCLVTKTLSLGEKKSMNALKNILALLSHYLKILMPAIRSLCEQSLEVYSKVSFMLFKKAYSQESILRLAA